MKVGKSILGLKKNFFDVETLSYDDIILLCHIMNSQSKKPFC